MKRQFSMIVFSAAVVASQLTQPTWARPRSEPSETINWAGNVHNLMLETAFPNENDACRLQMFNGSRVADSRPYQAVDYAYMHGMRKKGQTEVEAVGKFWDYIDSKYAEVRLLERSGRMDDACFSRGMALHPVMDSTSPAHRGFQQWDPLDLRAVFQHGDFFRYIEPIVPLLSDPSVEDMNFLDDHPEALRATADLIRAVDTAEMAGEQE